MGDSISFPVMKTFSITVYEVSRLGPFEFITGGMVVTFNFVSPKVIVVEIDCLCGEPLGLMACIAGRWITIF